MIWTNMRSNPCLFSFIAAHHRLIAVIIFEGITGLPLTQWKWGMSHSRSGVYLIPRGSHDIGRIIFRYLISSNNSRSSINRLPRVIPPPPPNSPLSPFSLLFISSLSSWSGIWSSKTDQWRFKLWKSIKGPNLEHLKSSCSVYLLW